MFIDSDKKVVEQNVGSRRLRKCMAGNSLPFVGLAVLFAKEESKDPTWQLLQACAPKTGFSYLSASNGASF